MYLIEFTSKVKRIIKKFTSNELEDFRNFMEIAEVNPFDKKLKTHKLNGGLREYYSARLNYSDRVVFFVQEEEHIIIINIGSHDDVY